MLNILMNTSPSQQLAWSTISMFFPIQHNRVNFYNTAFCMKKAQLLIVTILDLQEWSNRVPFFKNSASITIQKTHLQDGHK